MSSQRDTIREPIFALLGTAAVLLHLADPEASAHIEAEKGLARLRGEQA